jgi:hypothetical protein
VVPNVDLPYYFKSELKIAGGISFALPALDVFTFGVLESA